MVKKNVSATIDSGLKGLLEKMAQQERRSMSNLLEMLIEEKAVEMGLLPASAPEVGGKAQGEKTGR